MALREAVNEEDFASIRIAPVLRRTGEAVWRLHRDRLELLFLRLAARCESDEKCRDRHSGNMVPRGCANHLEVLPDCRCARAHRRSYEAAVSLDETEAIAPACTFHVGWARRPAHDLPHLDRDHVLNRI